MGDHAGHGPASGGDRIEGGFDPFSPEFRADPFSVYADFRARDPVHCGLALDGSGDQRWFVFRHRDAAFSEHNAFAAPSEGICGHCALEWPRPALFGQEHVGFHLADPG